MTETAYTRTTTTQPSTTVYASVVTQSLAGTRFSDGPVIFTVTATSVFDPAGPWDTQPLVATVTTLGYTTAITFGESASPSTFTEASLSSSSGNTGGGTDSTTKIALGVGIPLGIILVALLIAGAYLWGKRANRASRATENGEAPSGKDARKQSAEMHELPSEVVRQELPTKFNLAEMSASEGPREMALRSPVELPGDENGR